MLLYCKSWSASTWGWSPQDTDLFDLINLQIISQIYHQNYVHTIDASGIIIRKSMAFKNGLSSFPTQHFSAQMYISRVPGSESRHCSDVHNQRLVWFQPFFQVWIEQEFLVWNQQWKTSANRRAIKMQKKTEYRANPQQLSKFCDRNSVMST